ncbi:PHB depolymerase family esterase [Sphingomonas kaistensis]|uniref:PHB depolymerase family esterase n=1 Tax=Sphingomonas kaistensis TaxID=298708 RepID=A0ABZ2G602_9SPHN
MSTLRSRFANQSDPVRDDRLEEMTGFGANPGNLIARTYRPESLAEGAPLVVVLHGCTQSAGSYNRGAGWTSAADENGFALLFPEQQRANNPNLCFNWFAPTDTKRGSGEAASISQMVQTFCERHALDPARVFITGLSAGGAMTAAMLASYPELFAGGAVIGGLPVGTASTVPEAFERMRGQAAFRPGQLAELIRSASTHQGDWPTLSVWHGSSDATVDASNAAALVEQWRGLHGVEAAPTTTDRIGNHLRRAWSNRDGIEVIEEYVIPGMGHGTPIHAVAANQGEEVGPYMLDVGISSTRRLIAFWKLDGERPSVRKAASPNVTQTRELAAMAPVRRPSRPQSRQPVASSKVQDVIEKALRTAGLMK